MFSSRTLSVWTGILLLSSMFLMGQETWPPSDLIYCTDLDSDGYGVRPALLCPYVFYLDCDDTNRNVHPRAVELCNGIDDNCDTIIDYVDADGDGYISGTPPCNGNDCDDRNPAVRPGAPEICDGLDNNCDGVIPPAETDGDGDQFVACSPWIGADPGILGGGDCDDTRPGVNPGVTEAPYGSPICTDTLDNDCDGHADSQDNGCQQCSVQADCNDGNPCTNENCVAFACVYTYNANPCDDGNPCTMDDLCSQGICDGIPLDADDDGFVSNTCLGGDDCLDSNPAVNPAATEGPMGDPTCFDGLDNDCDGLADQEELDCIT
jgi:Putative metal-binding motif